MDKPDFPDSRLDHYRRELAFGPPQLIEKLLSVDMLTQALQACDIKFRARIFTPIITMWIWVRQRLEPHGSCRNAVSHAIAWILGAGQLPVSSDCSAYCQARCRQALKFIKHVVRQTAQALETPALDATLQRRVFLVDATSAHVSDTDDNRKTFRGPSGQQPGCGLPVVKMLALFGLATGAAWAVATGWTNASELALFYSLWCDLPANSLVVGDSNFGNFMTVAGLAHPGVDCLMRVDQARKIDFNNCTRRLARRDALFTWKHPRRCPWMSKAAMDKLPPTLLVRVFDYSVLRPGFKPFTVSIVTTLLDAKQYPASMLGELYARRWYIELEFRHIKTTMGMERMDAKTPEMVEKEIHMHLLTYNLVRQVMADASERTDLPIEEISFKGTLDLMRAIGDVLAFAPPELMATIYDLLLTSIGQRPIRPRPNRSEPRVIKQRHNKYPYMNKPRDQYSEHHKHTPKPETEEA